MKKIKIAIIGIGNCTSSLVQGIEYYKNKNAKDAIGLMHCYAAGAWAGGRTFTRSTGPILRNGQASWEIGRNVLLPGSRC